MTAHMQIIAAIRSLCPGSGFSFDGDVYPDGLTWEDEAAKPPTLDAVMAAIAAFPSSPVRVSAFALLGRLSDAEYTAIRQAASVQLAAGNGQLERWLDMARTAQGGVNLGDPVTLAAKATLVSAGLLTQARAEIVFAA
ncbi:MAG TPA: hypothetical protein VGN55_15875 [Xanthobacteraceae bacterium]|jgi:hypothetical protein